MANVTQTIHSLTQGISQQPDEQKIPGQVNDMENALPNITQGLLKRPAGEFVGSLTGNSNSALDATTTGRWFHYYRDEAEQYIGQVAKDGTVRMWDCLTGTPKTVVDVTTGSGAAKYLYHDGVNTSEEDIQTLTLNDFTYLNNRTKTVEMDTTTEPDTTFKKEMYVELKSISYSKQYALNIFSDTTSTPVTTATRIKVEKTDTDETDTCPHVATEIFDIGEIYHNSAKNQFLHPTSIPVRTSALNSTTYRQYTDRNRFVLDNSMKYNDDNSGSNNEGSSGEEQFYLSHGNTSGSNNDAHWKLEGTITNTDGTVHTISFVTGAFVGYGTYGGSDYSAWSNGAWRGSGPLVDSFKAGTNYSSQLFTIEECGVTATGAGNPGALIVILKNIDDSLTGTWTIRRCNSDGTLRSDQTDPVDYETGVAIPFDGTETNNWNGKGVGIDYVKDNNRKDLYFRLATTGQSVPTGASDNITYKCRYTTTYDLLFGGSGWASGDTFNISMKSGSVYSVTIEKISTSQVQANLAKARPQPTPFDTKTTITAQSILGDLRTEILNAKDSSGNNNFQASDVTIIGSGLYIKHTVKFNGSTPVGELLNVVAGKVSDVGDLPTQCKHGMVVEVINSAAEEDNYYVKFYGNNDQDGEGIWEECAQPGRKIRLKRSTMPVGLIRTRDGNFRLTELDGNIYPDLSESSITISSLGTTASGTIATINTATAHNLQEGDNVFVTVNFNGTSGVSGTYTNNLNVTDEEKVVHEVLSPTSFTIDTGSGLIANSLIQTYFASGTCRIAGIVPRWDDALVGDSVTNPEPSFVGKQINKLLFFRNRFAILADEFIVLSRAGDFTNFFAKSAIQLIASDPIDISSSSDTPAILYDGIEVNTGLVLFTKTQQFMLTTDSDAFTPLTAKINALSNYNFNYTTNPISMGTTIAFLDNAGKYSRFWEMTRIQREGEPQVIEQSAVVNKLFNKDLKYISNSKENSIIFFSEKGTNVLYGFRYFDQVFERKLASWFKWTFTGSIQYHCMQDDSLYVVLVINGQQQLQKFSIKRETTTPSVQSFNYRAGKAYLDFDKTIEYLMHFDCLTKVSTWASGNSNVRTGYTPINYTYDSTNDFTVITDNSTLPTLGLRTGLNFAAYNETGRNLVAGQILTGLYTPNLVKYVNVKASEMYDTNNSTIFVAPNHGFQQGDIVQFEKIGNEGATYSYSNPNHIADGFTFKVEMNNVNDTAHQFSLTLEGISPATSVGHKFTNYGNDQQVLKLVKRDGNFVYGANRKFVLHGDWRNQNFLVGYNYTMKIDLPTIYYSTKDGENFRSDSSANTIIHRIKMGFGPIGRYKAIVTSNFPSSDLYRSPIYEEEFDVNNVSYSNGITSHKIQDDVQQRVIPIYQKNKNATLTIESTHPTPATIHNLTWEGVYTPPYYTRV